MKLVFSTLIILIIVSLNFSQDDDSGVNRSKTTTPNKSKSRSPSSVKDKTKPKKSSTNSIIRKNSPKTEKTVTASLEVTVNQIGSRIDIKMVKNGVENIVRSGFIQESNEEFLVNNLETGNYLISVQKIGFARQERKVSLKSGKNTLKFILEASAGFLSVNSNIGNSDIEIKGVGNFNGRVEELMLPPGVYQLSITTEGYEPQTQTADVRAGQTTLVSASLTPISIEKLLQNAESNYETQNFIESLKICRLVLEKKPDEPRANLLMGYAYFYKERPQAGRFYLRRALALQAEVEIPVKYYQKEKNSETLTPGILKINQTELNFSAANNSALNFKITPSSIQKMEFKKEKQNSDYNSAKPDSIEIQAVINTGRKTEKKKLRFYPRQAFARVISSDRAEIASCSNCQNGNCICRSEIESIYELLLNWKTGTYPRQLRNEVELPAKSSAFYNNQFFSLDIPTNWQAVSQNESTFWFAPTGGFFRSQNTTYFRYGVNAGIRTVKVNNLRTESESLYQLLLQSENNYLDEQQPAKEITINGKKILVSTFAGFGIKEQEEEIVTIYTFFTNQGTLFYLVTVTPFNEKSLYQSTFRNILNSAKF